ncbi:DUF2155 domain-containing protein [Azospirillum halopraeferens]|uniref:DUF2155 domain-containing protein n=1 Tax=Azospirillum halopraeferens TaxID=34010 RepID=UPI00040B8FD8|nr:DUF2155 domain-containing protein [Azospirillum halopraeferens]
MSKTRALRAAAVAALVVMAGTAAAAPAPRQMIDRPVARLQGLDKITARTTTFDIAVGETKLFGGLRVTLRACKENPPIEPPESAAFLEVEEARPGEEAELVFSGWMFASSPALSAMESPVYDVWVLSCTGGDPS